VIPIIDSRRREPRRAQKFVNGRWMDAVSCINCGKSGGFVFNVA